MITELDKVFDELISVDGTAEWGIGVSKGRGETSVKPVTQIKYVTDNFETVQMHGGLVLVRNKVTGEQKWCSHRPCWEYQPSRITASIKEERAEEFWDADPHRMP